MSAKTKKLNSMKMLTNSLERARAKLTKQFWKPSFITSLEKLKLRKNTASSMVRFAKSKSNLNLLSEVRLTREKT